MTAEIFIPGRSESLQMRESDIAKVVEANGNPILIYAHGLDEGFTAIQDRQISKFLEIDRDDRKYFADNNGTLYKYREIIQLQDGAFIKAG